MSRNKCLFDLDQISAMKMPSFLSLKYLELTIERYPRKLPVMQKIIWSKEISVGHDQLDQEHQELADIINSLIEHQKTDDYPEFISSIFGKIIDFSQTHFSREERLLEQCGYPLLEQKKLDHEGFVVYLHELLMEAVNNQSDVVVKLRTFLVDWWQKHTSIEHEEFGAYLLSGLD